VDGGSVDDDGVAGADDDIEVWIAVERFGCGDIDDAYDLALKMFAEDANKIDL